MAKLFKKSFEEVGLPPGILKPSQEDNKELKITVIDYRESHFQEKVALSVEDCFAFKDEPTVTWINLDGLNNLASLEKLGEKFGIHPLVLEDILTTDQRPKMEDYDSYIYFVLKMLDYNNATGEVDVEQVSFVLGKNFVISFQEREGDVFNAVRDRIRNAKGRVRKEGADYLAYALIDAIVDNYFLILEKLGEKIEDLEEDLIKDTTQAALRAIHGLKREMIYLRKSVWPLREAIGNLQRSGSSLIKKSSGIYLRDVYDHTIQIIDTIETMRDMVSGMLDIYLSNMSNRMNEVMKVLTVIATIFIPLTFITGVYGMNFKHMPELDSQYGYFMVWGLMMGVAGLMFYYFKRKNWF
ncbi:MAG: magnesium/cobalt transporter CorA [Candidatus Omnitrophota bacterium]